MVRTTASNHCSSRARLRPTEKRENPDAQLAEDDGIHDEISFIGPQPFDDFFVWHRLGRLAEHVRIDEVTL